MADDALARRAKSLSLKLASWPSVTGTRFEADYPAKLKKELKNFDECWLQEVPGGAFKRKNLFALKRGKSCKTVVLTGHFDVVPAEDYGPLPAFNPERLLTLTIAKLKKTGENPKALKDFLSGDFLPGRGLLDMKAGLGAGIAAMEAYTGEATLLFVAVADEENRSAGACAAAPELRRIAEAKGLDIKLIINLDAISDQGDGKAAKVVTYGSIGKQLLSAFVIGKETHAGYAEEGINSSVIAAELISAFEGNHAFVEKSGAQKTAPPTTLCAKDLKQGYNVTTPASFWVYWNTLQYRRSGADILSIATRVARSAVRKVEKRFHKKITVTTFQNFSRSVPNRKRIIAETLQGKEALDIPEQTKRVMQALWAASGKSEPTVILGFASVPYMPVSLRSEALRKRIERAVKPFNIGSLDYFAGISDMSFFGETKGNLRTIAVNTPVWGKSFTLSETSSYPTINLGPWGRDYHHWLERLHVPYAFETLPKALLAVIEAVI